MKKAALVLCLLCLGAVLLVAVSRMPRMGDSGAPDKTYAMPRYVTRGLQEAGDKSVPNNVLLNYRGFDTFAAVSALLCAFCALLAVLGGQDAGDREERSGPRSGTMTRTVARLLIPLCILFAVYILVMGKDSFGYSLQTGIVAGGAIIFLTFVFNFFRSTDRVDPRFRVAMESVAVLLFIAVGLVPVFMGAGFLTLSLPGLSGSTAETVRSSMMILTDAGVGIATAFIITTAVFALMRGGGDALG